MDLSSVNAGEPTCTRHTVAAPMLQLLVIQPTSLCNLNCGYCYVPDRKIGTRLQFPTLKKLFNALVASRLISCQREIEVLWHAGEPLTVGIEFYRRAMEIINETLVGRWKANHSVQTNGTLLTPEWCEFFRRENVGVGISLDGPREIHDKQRPTMGGEGSFERAMQGVGMLRSHGIPVNALCVLTPASLRSPERMFEFFVSHGITNIAFNVEETEGVHRLSSLMTGGGLDSTKSLYFGFMRSMLQNNISAGFPLRIRELHALAQHIQMLRRWPGYVPSIAEQSLGAILTMTRSGLLTSWSPELASAAPPQLQRFVLGDVVELTSIDEIFETNRAKSIQDEIDCGVARCRNECKYFAVCGGGSPSNKFFEHGTFAGTKTLQCMLHTQALTEVLLGEFAG